MKRHRFLFIAILLAIVASLAGYGYFPVSQKLEDIKDLKYAQGEFEYYQTHWKYRSRKKSDRPFRKFLMIQLKDDLYRFKDGKFFLDHLEQNALLMLMTDWPRDTLEIGFLDTEDSGLKEMYDVKYQGESLVNLEGIRSSMKTEKTMMLVFSIVGALLSIVSLIKYSSDLNKKSITKG